VHSRPNAQHRSDTAGNLSRALGRLRYARQHFEKRGLARAIAADDADDLSGGYAETHITDRPKRAQAASAALQVEPLSEAARLDGMG
jgi:hypothetical protein